MMRSVSDGLKRYAAIAAGCLLSSCALVQFQPLQTIDKVDAGRGYRLEKALNRRAEDDTFVVLVFSGGGTRAAALGYGVLEELKKQQVSIGGV